MTVRRGLFRLCPCPACSGALDRHTHSDNIYARRGILAVKGESATPFARPGDSCSNSGAFHAYTRVKHLGVIGRTHILVVRGRKIHTPRQEGVSTSSRHQNRTAIGIEDSTDERTTTVDFFLMFCLKRPRMPPGSWPAKSPLNP